MTLVCLISLFFITVSPFQPIEPIFLIDVVIATLPQCHIPFLLFAFFSFSGVFEALQAANDAKRIDIDNCPIVQTQLN